MTVRRFTRVLRGKFSGDWVCSVPIVQLKDGTMYQGNETCELLAECPEWVRARAADLPHEDLPLDDDEVAQ